MEVLVGKRGIISGSTYWTLEDYVADLFDKRQTQGREFECLVRIFGKERIHQIFEIWLMKKNERDFKNAPQV